MLVYVDGTGIRRVKTYYCTSYLGTIFSEELNALHDLDRMNGGNEMNALLSLVLSMGQNRVAGALRFDSLDSPSETSADEGGADGGEDNGDDGDDRPSGPPGPDGPSRPSGPPRPAPARPERPPRAERPPRPPRVERLLRPERPSRPAPSDPPPHSDGCSKPMRSCHGLLTFEFQDDHAAGSLCHDGAGTSDDPNGKELEPIEVPAEVEIYLGQETPSTSRDMEWEGSVTEQKEYSSEDETTETSKDLKRKKLDSGIGEGTTTSSGSSPVKSESNCDDLDEVERSEDLSDEISEDIDEVTGKAL